LESNNYFFIQTISAGETALQQLGIGFDEALDFSYRLESCLTHRQAAFKEYSSKVRILEIRKKLTEMIKNGEKVLFSLPEVPVDKPDDARNK